MSITPAISFSRSFELLKPKLKTSQFFWYLGHVSTVVFTVLYQFFAIFSAGVAVKYYNYALLSVVTTYSIVLFQMLKSSKTTLFSLRNISSNDNFLYLTLATVWYLVSASKLISGGLYPFIVYSTLHAANYFRNHLLPLLPSVGSATKDRLSAGIAQFIAHYNEQSLMIATNCEIFILIQLTLGSPLILYYLITNFWLAVVNVIVLVQYACFIKLRYRSSKHIKLLFDGTLYKMEVFINSGRLPAGIVASYYQLKHQVSLVVAALPV